MRKGFLIFILLFSQISLANEPEFATSASRTATEDSDSPKESWTQRLIEDNITISNWFDGVAEGLDLFLAGKQLTKKKNNSKLRLEELIRSVEGQEVTHDFTLGVVLRLPNLEEYWQVKFTSYDEMEDKRQSQSDYLRRTPRQENYGASIGVFRKLGNVRVAFQPRVQLQNPISVSHSLSFESVAEMKTYSINPKLELYAVADKGTGVFWALNFNFYISKNYSLTLINNGDYVAQMHMESVTNGFAFQHVITDATAISYGTNFFSNNREHYHLEGYSFFTTWSQTVYKNILDFSVTPHWDFLRDLNWHGRAGLALNVGLSF
ncbi:MAG: hypothetical protein H7235_06590 [Bdellovibrionaceae bacterium]|nr:hypothetical protein [Pseudobdellovibrionaceae bacterium]